MKALLLTITISAFVVFTTIGVKSMPAQESVSVPCIKEKCQALLLFNKIIEIRNREDEDLKKIEQSLIHDPPGYTVALDRQADIEGAIKKAVAVESLYKDAGQHAHERAAACRKLLLIEQK
jgi:hypothetical protein